MKNDIGKTECCGSCNWRGLMLWALAPRHLCFFRKGGHHSPEGDGLPRWGYGEPDNSMIIGKLKITVCYVKWLKIT